MKERPLLHASFTNEHFSIINLILKAVNFSVKN